MQMAGGTETLNLSWKSDFTQQNVGIYFHITVTVTTPFFGAPIYRKYGAPQWIDPMQNQGFWRYLNVPSGYLT